MNTSIEGMLPVSGSVLDANGRIVNLVDLLGGGTPVSDTLYDTSLYAPQTGAIVKPDGTTVNLVDLLGGGQPVDDTIRDLSQYAPRSGLILGSDGKAYDLAALLSSFVNSSAPTYIARYNLTGEPNAAVPATLVDLSGNGNDMTLTGFTAYDANGRLTMTGVESFYLANLSLAGHDSYKLRLGFSNLTNGSNNKRVFNTTDDQFMLFMGSGADDYLVSSGGDTGSYLGYKFEWYNAATKCQYHTTDKLSSPSYTHLDTLMEITVSDCEVHYRLLTHSTANEDVRTTDKERDIFVHTAASMQNGVYFFNRAAGDRGLAATITTLEILAG